MSAPPRWLTAEWDEYAQKTAVTKRIVLHCTVLCLYRIFQCHS